MSTLTEQNRRLAQAWIDAFNAHDVPRLVALYAEGAVHLSPKLRVSRPETHGKVVGRAALTDWWSDAVRRLPGLRYQPTAIVADEERVIIEYDRHVPGEPVLQVAEAFDVREGQIVASRVYHG